ncbi:hypothetical protein I79_015672 [Cricetulus griseus]|uniref:Uncharacterized protein n=1 Tax=Cricetulus griseus TaxID=10029 RepID=G3HXF0_CRIGR|nr:hypothetical protein I79_015672 [Cricetulus griseus]
MTNLQHLNSENPTYLFKCPKRRCPLSNSLLQCIIGHKIGFSDLPILPPLWNDFFLPELIALFLSPITS